MIDVSSPSEGVPEPERMGDGRCVQSYRRHGRCVVILLSCTAASYGLTYVGLGHKGWSELHASEQLDLACFEFLGWWWVAYFSLSYFGRNGRIRRRQLFSLRSFLDQISLHRSGAGLLGSPQSDDLKEARRDQEVIREKAKSSRDVQGIMIAVIVLLLTLIVVSIHTGSPLHGYRLILRGPIFGLALVIILLWALSMDIFDTILNSFGVDLREAEDLRRYYYRRLGALGFLRGAVTYGYLGHALVAIFVLMILSWFQPMISGFGTALYVLLAYPYYYGYWAVQAPPVAVGCDQVDVRTAPRNWTIEPTPKDATRVRITRWLVNRDGDEAIRDIFTGTVDRSGIVQERAPAWWPPVVLCLVFLIPSIVVMAALA